MTPVDTDLAGRIRSLYDATTGGWVDVWGEHLHHGFYPEGRRSAGLDDHRRAQVEMIDQLLAWGRRPDDRPVRRILDAGCGVGGSSRHLADATSAEVLGLTLSPVQRRIAEERSGPRGDLRFEVRDATATGRPEASFDLIWALESAEHMPDKAAFLAEAMRLLAPGGRLTLATWCHRPVPPELEPSERGLLDGVSRSYGRSLTWVPLADYPAALDALGAEDVRTDDWSFAVKPFWGAVLRSALSPRGLWALARGGAPMIRGAYGGMFMRRGLARGTVRYVVVTARKPTVAAGGG